MKMQSCAGWTSRPHQQVGPPPQYSQAATQFTYNTARNLPAAAASTTHWNRTENTGVGPPIRANFSTFLYGHYSNIQPSSQQAAAAPHQAVSAGRNDYYQRASQTDTVQHSSANAQSGYTNSPVSQQDFSQNSAQDSSYQCPPSMAPNAAYPQQVKSAHWNQSVRLYQEQSVRIQVDTTAYNYQHCRDQNSLFHSFNGESTRPVSTCTTTATSPAPEEVVYTAAAYTRQTAHKHSARINNAQHGSPPHYHTALSQADFRNNSITAKSSGQNLHCSSTSPKTQPTHKDSSINSNTAQYYNTLLFSKINGENQIPLNPQQEMQKMIARIEGHLREPRSAGSDGRSLRFARSSSRQKELVSKGRMKASNQNVQPVASEVTKMCSLNSSQSLLLKSSQYLPNSTHSVMSTQHSIDVPPQQSSGLNVSATSLSNPDKLLISPKSRPDGPGVELYPYLENPNQMLIDASSDGAFVSDSARPQDFSQKQSCADDTGREPVDMQVDQVVAVPAQQSVACKALMSRNKDEDKNEMPTEPNKVFDLSSVPTTPWTHGALTKMVQDAEKAQMRMKRVEVDFLKKVISMFWDSNILDHLKDFDCNILQAETFCRENESQDSVILSQVKYGFENQLKSYHVLKDNEGYSEVPYRSSWLNISEQLDDIDKEFGFPQMLKQHSHTIKSNRQTDQLKTHSSVPPQTINEVSNKKLSPKELEPVESSEEKQDATLESTSTQMASPNETDSTDFGDSYSFKIQVLPPEEAKLIFEQVSSKQPQSMDTDNRPERHTNSSVEDGLLRDVDASSRDTKLEKDLVRPVEEFCCIALMKEMIWGSDTVSKCQCKYKSSHKNDTGKTPVENAEEKKDVLSSKEKNDLCYIIDLTEHEDQPPTYSVKELHSSCESTSPNWSSIILSSDNEDHNHISDFESDSEGAPVKLTERSQSSGSDGRNISRSEEIQSDPEVDFGHDGLKSTGNTPSCCDKGIENLADSESDIAGQMLNAEEKCEAAPLSSAEELTEISGTCAQQTADSSKHKTDKRKRKRLSSRDRFFPIFKKSNKSTSLVDVDSQTVHEDASKCGKVFDDGGPSASHVRTVKLSLFGSTAKNKCMFSGSRKSHAPSHAPQCLTVNLSPKKRKRMRRKTISTWNYSVKQLYKKWKISFPPSKINTEILTRSGKDVPCLRLKRMWSLTDEEEETEKDTVALSQHDDAENGSYAVMPSQNNGVLNFCVLPQSFTFSDGFSGPEEYSDSVPDKPDLVERTDMTPSFIKARGTWCSVPKYFSPPSKRTQNLFHEFQKKYKEAVKLSISE